MPMSVSVRPARRRFHRVVARTVKRLPAAVYAYRFLRHPRWEVELRIDLARTRRTTAFLRRPEPSTLENAPVALVALYRDNVRDTKLALMLATGLRLRGLTPVVVVPSSTHRWRVRRYARAFGVKRVIAQDTLRLTPTEVAGCRKVSQELLADAFDFSVVRAWRYHGYQLGNHVLSTLIRATLDGAPDLTDDRVRQVVERVLDETLVNYVRAERLVRDLGPKVVLVEEANYSTNGPLVDVAVNHGIDVIRTIPTWRDDALISKRLSRANRRVDARAVAPETLTTLDACFVLGNDWNADLDHDFRQRYGRVWAMASIDHPATEEMRSDEIVAEVGLDPERPTAVIFSPVLWDGTLFYGSDLFENYAEWLKASLCAATMNDQVNWIVKAHPSNVFRTAHGDVSGEPAEVRLARAMLPQFPAHVHMLLPDTRISAASLYAFADYGVAVRGTPGLEMACFGKRVFTAGTGNYSGIGFTCDSDSIEEYLDKLGRIQTFAPLSLEETQNARRYAYAFFVRHPWRVRSFDLTFNFREQGWHPLDRNLVIRATSQADLHQCGDLDAWASWVLDTRDEDFVTMNRPGTSVGADLEQ
jgi:hypothetical protein